MTLLLASGSVTRQEMLRAAGVPFEVTIPTFDEDEAKAGLAIAGFEPRDMAEMLAELKATATAVPIDAIVLGADQVLEDAGGAMFDKPATRAEARAQLLALSGAQHQLHSAAVLVRDGARIWGMVETVTLWVRPLSETFIDAYLDREGEAVLGCAGGYRIEALGAQLFDRVEGSHFAVLGLPLLPLLGELRQRAILPT